MIKIIYFDLGGVVIRDFSGTRKWDEIKSDLGVSRDQYDLFDDIWNRYHNEYMISRDVDTLLPILKEELRLSYPEGYSLLIDIVGRFEPNPDIAPVLETAKRNSKIGLLTNAYPRMLSEVRKRGIMPRVDFNFIIDSSDVKLQKPDYQIYEHATVIANSKPAEILFIDNLLENIEAAEKFGWNVYLYDSENPASASESLQLFLEEKYKDT